MTEGSRGISCYPGQNHFKDYFDRLLIVGHTLNYIEQMLPSLEEHYTVLVSEKRIDFYNDYSLKAFFKKYREYKEG